jgi:uncharacterized membrane protein
LFGASHHGCAAATAVNTDRRRWFSAHSDAILDTLLAQPRALDVLDRRLAKGDTSVEEYERRRTLPEASGKT